MSKAKTTPDLRPKFWERFDLGDLSKPEWEALCDGCGKCCVIKLEDDDTDELHYTDVACRLFDVDTCRCGNYALRKQMVSGCVVLTPENIDRNGYWMPSTCAYRLLSEGDTLPDWHPLITGTQQSVIDANISVAGKLVSEFDVDEDDLEDHVIEGFQ
ncbi:UPF0260 protein [Amylibacter ulvae]|uniref:UPF0260 protein GCM10008927_16760 n=1 Tax=Paramylibacter ulvae TaxID=1651968 RepID=A0ABQ3D007_9RHOB|nr:YcgN family cysteine cluster protein [Amylibacter ulvae]GHA51891.1 UPF0260 protein [Amylibacter ulvae]